MFENVDNNIITELAIRGAVLFFGAAIAGILTGIVLNKLRMPIWIIKPAVGLTALFVMYQMFMLGIADF